MVSEIAYDLIFKIAFAYQFSKDQIDERVLIERVCIMERNFRN